MKEKKYIKIWGEHISLKQLLLATIISIAFVVIFLIIESTFIKKEELKLLFGLLGVLLAFSINVVLFKPKRNIKQTSGDNNDN